MATARSYEMAPRAARLTNSMRDIGYNFPAAVADLVDNCVAAGATNVDIELVFDGEESCVLVADNGSGMTANRLNEALRFGSISEYQVGDLGRFGLGLKTASLSQCRRVSVVSRANPYNGRVSARSLDLSIIEEWDEWLVVADHHSPGLQRAKDRLGERGTVVVWEDLDRVLPERMIGTGWGRRRFSSLAAKTASHIAMVFHRFLSGEAGKTVTIRMNGEPIRPWDPFARDERRTRELDQVSFEITHPGGLGEVSLRPFILPTKRDFSSIDAFERLSGPLRWNRQQGLYVYRAHRLVQAGGWSGIRGIDEHTKLARAALEFNTDLDDVFQINVAKMRIQIPAALKQLIERPIHELCIAANEVYRRDGQPNSSKSSKTKNPGIDLTEVGLAIRSAALECGHLGAIADVEAVLRQRSPQMSRALGFI